MCILPTASSDVHAIIDEIFGHSMKMNFKWPSKAWNALQSLDDDNVTYASNSAIDPIVQSFKDRYLSVNVESET